MVENDRWAGMPVLQAQSEILTEISQDLVRSITGDWVHATFTVILFGGQRTAGLEVVDEDNNSRFARFQAASDLASSLKRVMFVEGWGSWFTMRLTIRNGGPVETDFDCETKPEFDSEMLGVTPYWTAREQHDFPRDRVHQPQWYAQLLDEFRAAEQARVDMVAARDRLWAGVGRAGQESDFVRLVTLASGVGIVATDGYSNPSPNHPGDPGFELYMPSMLFAGDVKRACEAWPMASLDYVVKITTEQDIDWPSRVGDWPWSAVYFPNVVNRTPPQWRGDLDGQEVCAALVGVSCPGVPDTLDGPLGPIRLVGVVPARPAEWEFLECGEVEVARRDLADRFARLDPMVLASPDRPSVV